MATPICRRGSKNACLWKPAVAGTPKSSAKSLVSTRGLSEAPCLGQVLIWDPSLLLGGVVEEQRGKEAWRAQTGSQLRTTALERVGRRRRGCAAGSLNNYQSMFCICMQGKRKRTVQDRGAARAAGRQSPSRAVKRVMRPASAGGRREASLLVLRAAQRAREQHLELALARSRHERVRWPTERLVSRSRIHSDKHRIAGAQPDGSIEGARPRSSIETPYGPPLRASIAKREVCSSSSWGATRRRWSRPVRGNASGRERASHAQPEYVQESCRCQSVHSRESESRTRRLLDLARVDARKRRGDVSLHEGRLAASRATTLGLGSRFRPEPTRHTPTKDNGKDAKPDSIPGCTR